MKVEARYGGKVTKCTLPAASLAAASRRSAGKSAGCGPGNVHPGFVGPEDLVEVPNSNWITPGDACC
jgi:hypothetical protein